MDKKIFAIFLLGILLVTPFASAGFGEWVSSVFSTQNAEKSDVIIGPIMPKSKGGSGSSHSEPIGVIDDPIDDSAGSSSVYVGYNLNTHKILAQDEILTFGRKGYIQFKKIDDNSCHILVQEPFKEDNTGGGQGVVILEAGEMRVINRDKFNLVIGVTALTQDSDSDNYCSVVLRYEQFEETEEEQPVDENPTPDVESSGSGSGISESY
jgi:hypothetical protein